MPSIEDNLRAWGRDYDWSAGGDEWSAEWGGSGSLWRTSLRPRVQAYLPAGTVLEIAPGHGRWSAFLAAECRRLVLVDLAPRCVDACRLRFADVPHVECHQNDGRTLPMVGDGSIDFAFSFDSLVHAELDDLTSYLRELARVLAPDGVAFLHHSNLAAVPAARLRLAAARLLPAPLARRVGFPSHWRARSVSGERVLERAADVGLVCVKQERINWGGGVLLDAFSTLARRGSAWDRETEVVENRAFMEEAVRARQGILRE